MLLKNTTNINSNNLKNNFRKYLKAVLIGQLLIFPLITIAVSDTTKAVSDITKAASDKAKMYQLKTKIAGSPKETFSDLILIPKLHPTNDFEFSFVFKVKKQLRLRNPNPWESFWIFWSYNPTGDNLKTTNYLAFKTNGLEAGKAFNDVDQTFIWTNEKFKLDLNQNYKLYFKKTNGRIEFSINDQYFLIDQDLEKKFFLNPGRLGLYVEDAEAEVSGLIFNILK